MAAFKRGRSGLSDEDEPGRSGSSDEDEPKAQRKKQVLAVRLVLCKEGDDHWLISATEDGEIVCWDLKKFIETIKDACESVERVLFHGDAMSFLKGLPPRQLVLHDWHELAGALFECKNLKSVEIVNSPFDSDCLQFFLKYLRKSIPGLRKLHLEKESCFRKLGKLGKSGPSQNIMMQMLAKALKNLQPLWELNLSGNWIADPLPLLEVLPNCIKFVMHNHRCTEDMIQTLSNKMPVGSKKSFTTNQMGLFNLQFQIQPLYRGKRPVDIDGFVVHAEELTYTDISEFELAIERNRDTVTWIWMTGMNADFVFPAEFDVLSEKDATDISALLSSCPNLKHVSFIGNLFENFFPLWIILMSLSTCNLLESVRVTADANIQGGKILDKQKLKDNIGQFIQGLAVLPNLTTLSFVGPKWPGYALRAILRRCNSLFRALVNLNITGESLGRGGLARIGYKRVGDTRDAYNALLFGQCHTLFSRLEVLKLSQTDIESITYDNQDLLPHFFSGCTKLRSLDLSENQFASPDTFDQLIRVMRNVTSLCTFILRGNCIHPDTVTQMLDECPIRLANLDFRDNGITDESVLADMQRRRKAVTWKWGQVNADTRKMFETIFDSQDTRMRFSLQGSMFEQDAAGLDVVMETLLSGLHKLGHAEQSPMLIEQMLEYVSLSTLDVDWYGSYLSNRGTLGAGFSD